MRVRMMFFLIFFRNFHRKNDLHDFLFKIVRKQNLFRFCVVGPSQLSLWAYLPTQLVFIFTRMQSTYKTCPSPYMQNAVTLSVNRKSWICVAEHLSCSSCCINTISTQCTINCKALTDILRFEINRNMYHE